MTSLRKFFFICYIGGLVKNIISVTAIFERCNPEEIDCEYFQSWTLIDICTKLKGKESKWSKWYSSYDPPMVCPINKRHYQLKNGSFDTYHTIQWYPEATDHQWKIKQIFYAGDVMVGAYTIDLSIFSYRKKSKSIIRF